MANVNKFEIFYLINQFPSSIETREECDIYLKVYDKIQEYTKDKMKMDVLNLLDENAQEILKKVLTRAHSFFLKYSKRMCDVSLNGIDSIIDKISDDTEKLIRDQILNFGGQIQKEYESYEAIMDKLTNAGER